LPVVSGWAQAPVLRPDGTVMEEEGLDEATGVLYLPAVPFEPVPEQPGERQAAALEAVRRVVSGFDLSAEADFSASAPYGWDLIPAHYEVTAQGLKGRSAKNDRLMISLAPFQGQGAQDSRHLPSSLPLRR
jgi:hypothetical protein